MEYQFREIEKKWQQGWKDNRSYQVPNQSSKPKSYVLDMFPYPSGAGLHVGHPLGYIASDIYSRFKRLKGFNVLHPMGYDAFGLPAEQYALEHGVHPAVSTNQNIDNFRRQLDNMGFCYDWEREVRTCDPSYYKWTQWIFLQLYNSWFNTHTQKAEPITSLIVLFNEQWSNAAGPRQTEHNFTAEEWEAFNEDRQLTILMDYRLAFCGYGEVNWCEALGTVLANDEVINGVSERGGHPVVKKKLRQWYLRITDYADRLLKGLETVEFSEAMKEMQSNWIGKSYGAEIDFEIKSEAGQLSPLRVYTTRPDTIFGVDFMVVAPELELVQNIASAEQKAAVDDYLTFVKSRSERERMAEKKISGVFTGAYAVNPFDGKLIPIWASEYVLAGYGTGAIMAVPCGDERDFKFAQHFNIPVTNIIGEHFNGQEANPTKDAILHNSGFLNGMLMRDAIAVAIAKIEEMGIGTRKVNFKIRDAAFSRQRYWGEPFPITWKNGVARDLPVSELPLKLPHVESYQPGPEGEGPLANIPEWVAKELETNTMPGYAGSSWYFLRYMDPHNQESFCDRAVSDYWGQVDVYIGGTEHAVGHLLYSRMWTKVLYDLGHIGFDEPFRKLINQGMIQGSSRFVYRVKDSNTFVSKGLKDQYETTPLHVDVNLVDGLELDTEAFKKWKPDYLHAEFILEGDKYICGSEVEKMSKSKFNTVNPDMLVEKYGADTFRMYEMFLGPVEISKPWDTKGIEGVHRFLKKCWRLFYDEMKGKVWTEGVPTAEELKVLHKAIKKIEEDTERFSFNTAVSAFMICVNELADLKCHKKSVLEQLLILLTPYAPHFAEELWRLLGNAGSVLDASYPVFDETHVVESTKEYPVSVNGKLRTTLTISLAAEQPEVESLVLSNETVQKWMEGKAPKKIIFIKGKMVNIVV
jgi:leucyl-tRNA synthetase